MKTLLRSTAALAALSLAGVQAAAISPAAIAAPARASDPPATIMVAYSTRDLASVSGQTKIRDKIAWAATAVCAGDDRASPAPPSIDRQCFRAALSEGLGQLERAVAQAGESGNRPGGLAIASRR